jgi:hypothetical protein
LICRRNASTDDLTKEPLLSDDSLHSGSQHLGNELVSLLSLIPTGVLSPTIRKENYWGETQAA